MKTGQAAYGEGKMKDQGVFGGSDGEADPASAPPPKKKSSVRDFKGAFSHISQSRDQNRQARP